MNDVAHVYQPEKVTTDIEKVSLGDQRIVVVGSGPAGFRFINELLKRDANAHITVFNNEPFQPYNRVQLSALLAGDISYERVFQSLPDESVYKNFKHIICKVESFNTQDKTLLDANGDTHQYDTLILATGSRAHVPNIPGVNNTGVYTFRNLKDAESLYARMSSAKHVVVAGGGLLGIEAARALYSTGTKVTLIQQGPRLMNRQLDAYSAALLTEKVEALGIRVIVNTGLKTIHANDRVIGVSTRQKETIECDTVLLCAGISPNIEMARNARLKVGRGIIVNDQLQTSADDVYAIGECCEHDGQTYGLVNPGYEQAAIAADAVANGQARYKGSVPISRLKVINEQVCSMGEVADVSDRPLQKAVTYKDKKQGIYRKLVLRKGRLLGALGFGEWPEARRIEEAYKQNRVLWPWQLWLFRFTGKLWSKDASEKVSEWPKATLVCQCNAVSQGTCVDAIAAGCSNAASLSSKTGAGTVCGSCKPLLEQLVEQLGFAAGPRSKELAWQPLLIASMFAVLLAALITFIPSLKVSASVQSPGMLESLWNDKFWKQVTGFTLLGMSVVGLLMSLRKRIKNKSLSQKLGAFAYWRLMHVVLGVFCAATLILHTGMHLGENLNQMLMIDFLLVLLLGSLAGGVVALSHRLSATSAQKVRQVWTWAHVLVTWPLPILLAFHILTVYYY